MHLQQVACKDLCACYEATHLGHKLRLQTLFQRLQHTAKLALLKQLAAFVQKLVQQAVAARVHPKPWPMLCTASRHEIFQNFCCEQRMIATLEKLA